MKKYFWIPIVLVAVVGVLWWGNEHIQQPPVEFLPMLCAEEEFYTATDQLASVLPENWTELGEITELLPNTQELPRRHLVSNCCGVGTKYMPRPARAGRRSMPAFIHCRKMAHTDIMSFSLPAAVRWIE